MAHIGASSNNLLDLSGCSGLLSVDGQCNSIVLSLPPSLKSFYSMSLCTPTFHSNTELNSLSTNGHSGSTHDLFTAVLNCKSVANITINCSSDYNPFDELYRFEGKGLTSFRTRYCQATCDATNFKIPSTLTNLEIVYVDNEGSFTPSATKFSVTNMPSSVVSPNGCSLTNLKIHNTNISSIGFLNGLTTLTSIDLRGNSISTIGNIGTHSSLGTLRLAYNNITGIRDLKDLKSVTFMDLANNALYDNGTYTVTTEGENGGQVSTNVSYKNLDIIKDLNYTQGKGGNLQYIYLENNNGITDFSSISSITWRGKTGF